MKKKLAVFGILIIFLFSSCFIYSVDATKTMAFKKGKYKFDSTNKYIIDIPGYTTVKEFKSNIITFSLKGKKAITVDGVKDEEREYIKTGDVVKVGSNTYIAVVLGDIDGDGKCTYKDILMEQWLYDNPDSDLVEYAKMRKSRRRKSGSTNANAGDIIQTCVDVLDEMLTTGKGNTYGAQTWNDIKKTSEEDTSYVCATYVAVVLYRSGALTEDQLNAFNYHYTGAGGFPDMLEAAGWYQVDPSEAEPGDVINVYGYHVLIYAGGDDCYDETCAQDKNTTDPWNAWPYYKNDPRTQVWRAPYTNSSTSDKLQSLLDEAKTSATSSCGGDWAIYAASLSSGEQGISNNSKMKAASLIKLFIMGAVYENYSSFSSQKSYVDNNLYSMITVSDNASANNLVNLLGYGNSAAGRDKVNSYCKSHGYSLTEMGRMLQDSNPTGDNYTSVSDCGKFLQSVYKGELDHSDDMLNLLKQQTRTTKIPAGVPGVQTANKTGELYGDYGDYAENDAAIVFSNEPYVLVVMSNKSSSLGNAVGQIQGISKKVYNYFNK